MSIGQVIVAIGPYLYEVCKGKECKKCAFHDEAYEPCWALCHDFFPQEGAHFRRLDAVRCHKVLEWLEQESQKEKSAETKEGSANSEPNPPNENRSGTEKQHEQRCKHYLGCHCDCDSVKEQFHRPFICPYHAEDGRYKPSDCRYYEVGGRATGNQFESHEAVPPVPSVPSVPSNYAKLREELGALLTWAEHNLRLSPDLLKEGTRECCEMVVACCKAALAAPPRNIDVGTLKEQERRYHKLGEVYHTLTLTSALKWARQLYKGGAE